MPTNSWPHDCLYTITDTASRAVIGLGSYAARDEARTLAGLVEVWKGHPTPVMIQTWGPGRLPSLYRFDARKSLSELAAEADALQTASTAALVVELLNNAGAGLGELLQDPATPIAPAQRLKLVDFLDALREARDDCGRLDQAGNLAAVCRWCGGMHGPAEPCTERADEFTRPHSVEPPAPREPRVENGTLAGRDPQLAAALQAEIERVQETQRGHILGPIATSGPMNMILDASYALRRGDSDEMRSHLERLRRVAR